MMTKPRLTRHAQMRRKQMKVTEDRIARVLADPQMVYPGVKKEYAGCMCHQRDDLVIVTASDGMVVTVLWHGKEGR